jgi:SAM-dependent methyltransferase
VNCQIGPEIQEVIVCPQCREKPAWITGGRFQCRRCNAGYEWTEAGSLDLRLKAVKNVSLAFEVGSGAVRLEDFPVCDPLPLNPAAQLDFSAVAVPLHLSRELMSYFPKAAGRQSLALDLGCGDTVHRGVCEHGGFTYVGLDRENPAAPILGDAHALPFRDESFEFVLSVAVLEHIQFPFVMMREVFRVLKPAGVFLGTVSFLEPFHGNSYYHHTLLGVINSLQYGGFHIEKLAPNNTVFDAQSRMSAWAMFPRMPRFLSTSIIKSPKVAWRLWWSAGRLKPAKRGRSKNTSVFAGVFSFVARKGSVRRD